MMKAKVRRERERRDPEATKQALLEAGSVLFAEHGFDGVSIDDVAGRAGVNKALGFPERLGIVRELTARKRNRVFSYSGYIEIMNRGAELPLSRE